jgi:hypothetical protein
VGCGLEIVQHAGVAGRSAAVTSDARCCFVLQGVPAFREPDLRWWQRRRVAPADAAGVAELQRQERQLTVEQVSHFRCRQGLGSPNARPPCCAPLAPAAAGACPGVLPASWQQLLAQAGPTQPPAVRIPGVQHKKFRSARGPVGALNLLHTSMSTRKVTSR